MGFKAWSVSHLLHSVNDTSASAPVLPGMAILRVPKVQALETPASLLPSACEHFDKCRLLKRPGILECISFMSPGFPDRMTTLFSQDPALLSCLLFNVLLLHTGGYPYMEMIPRILRNRSPLYLSYKSCGTLPTFWWFDRSAFHCLIYPDCW